MALAAVVVSAHKVRHIIESLIYGNLTAAVIGVLISIPVVRHMPQETFRKLLLVMIFIAGATLVGRTVL